MSLKSSTKTDVNTTELIISIDADAFEAAVGLPVSLLRRNSVRVLSMRARSILSLGLRLTQQSRRQVLFSLTDPMLR